MFKTNHPIQFELSESILDILSDFITVESSSNQINLSNPRPIDFLHERKVEYDFNQKANELSNKNPFKFALPSPPKFVFLKELDFHVIVWSLDSEVDSYLKSLTELELRALLTDIDEYNKRRGKVNLSARTLLSDGFYEKKVQLIDKFKNKINERLVQVRASFYLEMKNQLHQLGTSIETKNNFVFKS